MPVSAHRVAIVVFCEAEGTDARDAAFAAQYAIQDALRTAGDTSPDAHAKVASTRESACAHCGARAGTDADGRVVRHVGGEPFYPDPDPDDPSYRPEQCPGTGELPRPDEQVVVGYDRRDGHGMYARVHEVMEAGMALGNGYLWAGVTTKAFHH